MTNLLVGSALLTNSHSTNPIFIGEGFDSLLSLNHDFKLSERWKSETNPLNGRLMKSFLSQDHFLPLRMQIELQKEGFYSMKSSLAGRFCTENE